jgi:uncharacterized protein YciI
MAAEIPEGLAIETVWVVECTLGPDAAERRAAVRSEHLTRIGELRAAGIIVEAGAFSDMTASLITIRAATEEAALAVVRADVYTRAGVWVAFRARTFGRVISTGEASR